jgi:hypothetical protein
MPFYSGPLMHFLSGVDTFALGALALATDNPTVRQAALAGCGKTQCSRRALSSSHSKLAPWLLKTVF